MFEWYYVGQYGQLGPLSEEQMLELAESRVIEADTLVWKTGMGDWVTASSVPAFAAFMRTSQPPPVPLGPPAKAYAAPAPPAWNAGLHAGAVVSPCNRVLGGILQIIPGVGRMYLGYLAIGVLQLILSVCSCGLLAIWPIVDGVLILAGAVKFDGYGRILKD